MTATTRKRNNLGRPVGKDGDRVRADLLDAAREHFLSREFKAVSIRRIAATAGVNGAMVNYYFGGKQGLYMAMVEDLFRRLEDSLGALDKDSALTVADFSRSYCKLLAENPWWPNFFVREVLFSEGETREAIIDKFRSVFAPRLLQSIQAEISAGHFRQDLNPGLTLLSLMAMTIFPFLAKPMVEQILQLSLDETTVGVLAAHNTQLFLHGVEVAAGAEAQS
ncbi:MAG: TetR/AcrR family transcriptional regulator [Proteobacteria bacterium]|nr:TetR/AcrR family transcriptional regulator [Pseudomonadota bacterium]